MLDSSVINQVKTKKENMKHIYKIATLVFAAVLLFLSSCNKAIDLKPVSTADGDLLFNKIDDYEFALTGTYARLLQNSYYGSTGGANAFVGLPDMMSDNFFESSESLGNYTDFYNWSYTADDPFVQDIWEDAYTVVQQANLTMRGIDKFASTNPGAVNRIKGQALALRALAHFDLLRFFGEEYDRNSTAKGVPYVEVFDIEQKPSRLTVKASYDKIEADLKAAKNLFLNMDKSIQSATSTASTARANIDDMVVNAMLARMYLYANELDSAIKYSTLVINARPLASRTNFPGIWQDINTNEVIWSVKFQAFNSDIGGNIYYSVGNRASYRPSTNLVTTYDQANDIRYSSYFQARTRGSGSRLVLSKYLAKQAKLLQPDGIVDFKAFRTGEMYLIRAEAYARLGGVNEVNALNDLNILRLARISGFVPGTETGTALMNAIKLERRKELVAEGHRFFDLKRYGRLLNRTTNCSLNCTLTPDAREWTLPIPQSEILANPNMTQTDGY